MRYAVVGLVFLVVGCTDLFGPEVRFWNRRPMEPVPEQYATWYAEVEDCLGVTGDFGAVEWLVADSIVAHDGAKRGYLEFPNTITVRWEYLITDYVIRHEIAHHVTQSGDELHDSDGAVPCQ